MVDLVKHFVEPIVADYEQNHVQPNNLTWLDKQALQRKGAKSAHVVNLNSPQSADDAYVANLVGAIAKQTQTYPSKIIIYDNGKSGAMHLNNNSLAISQQKIEGLPPELLAATIAHELSHQRDNKQSNMIANTRIVFELGAGIAAALAFNKQVADNSVIGKIAAVAIGATTTTLMNILVEPFYCAFRRNQELDADKFSAQTVGAEPMIAVLEGNQKMHHTREKSWLENLNTKHPSHATRISALQEIAKSQAMQLT